MAKDKYQPRRVKHGTKRKRDGYIVLAVTLIAAVAAVFAPVSLTGNPVIDAVERFVVVALVTYVGAHGHRWAGLAAGAVLLPAARGVSLVLVLISLLVTMSGVNSKRRSKIRGVLISATAANAAFWFPDTDPAWLPVVGALVAMAILVVSGYPEVRQPAGRIVRGVLIAIPVAVVVAVIGTGWAALAARADLEDGTTAARAALRHVEEGNTEQATVTLERARSHLKRADSRLGLTVVPARVVPSLAQQVHAVEVAVEQGRRVADAADDLLASADYDDLRYDGRIDLAQVGALAPGARNVRAVLARAESQIAEVSSPWLLPPLQSRLDEFETEIAEVLHNADLASDLLELAPVLFGAEGPEHYLVAFLTPAELRGAGGFIGNYAELRAHRGDVELSESGRILNLIQATRPATRRIEGPQEYLDRYGRFRPHVYLQDVTFSPHFPHSADVFAQLYPQAGGRDVRAVIGIDPIGLAGLLQFTGPVEVEGLDVPLSQHNAVEVLLREQYLSFEDEKQDRKDVLDEATRATFEKLTTSSLPSPRRIGEVLGPIVRGRHIQLWSDDPKIQALFTRIGADGSATIPEGIDGFSVVQQNAGNNKLDAYLQREVEYLADVDVETGRLSGTLTVRLRNEVPRLDMPRDVVGNSRAAPVGTNVTWLSIFTPHAIIGATVDGQPMSVAPDSEAGMNVYDTGLLHVPPGGLTELVFEVSGAVDLSDGYEMWVVPQALANPDEVRVVVSPMNGTFEGPGVVSGALVREDLLEEIWELGVRALR